MNKNVYQLALERIELIFNEFDNIYVSFSGGKDSGVLLNLCIDYIRTHQLNRRIGVFHIDYEAQYQMTTDYVDEIYNSNSDILDYYRVCLPISAQCCTSMFQNHWVPWEKGKEDIWARSLPSNCINEDNHEFDFFKEEMWDYELQEKFSSWIHKKNKAKKTACLVGIRTQESFNRWRAIYSDRNYKKYKSLNWSKKQDTNIYNFYPVFDWLTEDIWIANGRFKWSYNRLYDLFYQAGVTIDKMRVASPFNDAAPSSLKLYRVIDPNSWGKMVSRVNGVNFTGIYGGTTAMGWNSIKLPPGHTWESYMFFLLKTLPAKTRDGYIKKLETSMKFWKEKGGCLSSETIKKLTDAGVKFKVQENTNYQTAKKPVKMDYLDDINISEFKEIPTFKRMCICIMKNDHLCKYMGFSQTKDELTRRKRIIDKYKNL